MKNVLLLFVHFVSIVIRLIRPAGTKMVLAESLLLKHQLILLNRSCKKSSESQPIGPLPARTLDALNQSWPPSPKRGDRETIDALAFMKFS